MPTMPTSMAMPGCHAHSVSSLPASYQAMPAIPRVIYRLNEITPAFYNGDIPTATDMPMPITELHLDSIKRKTITSSSAPYFYTAATETNLNSMTATVNYKLNEMRNYLTTSGYQLHPDVTATGPSPDLKYNSWITDYNVNHTSATISFVVNTANYRTINFSIKDDYYEAACPKVLRTQTLKARLKSNLAICIKSRAGSFDDSKQQERVAKQTLREIVTEVEFRKYLKYGFVLVKSDSGAVYQVFRNNAHTKVWKGGRLIEEICVRLQGDVPSTDNVIAFKTMIETDEYAFRKLGNVYPMKKAA